MQNNKLMTWFGLIFLVVFLLGCSGQSPKEPPLMPALELERRNIPPAWMVVSAQRLDFDRPPNTNPFGFGQAIALGDGVLAVGAPARMGPGLDDPGQVYVFRQGPAGWDLEIELGASDRDDGFQYTQQFGSALAIQDGFLYVGAPAADDPLVGDNTGAVYIFEDTPGGWVEIGKLTSPEPAANGNFGTMLALHGSHLAAAEGQFYDHNRIWLFRGAGADWQLTSVVAASEMLDSRGGIMEFDLYGDTLSVVKSYFSGEGSFTEPQGWVEIYDFDGAMWNKTAQLPSQAQAAEEQVFIAQRIALDGRAGIANRLAIGAPMSRTSGFMSGAVYLYAREGDTWNFDAVLATPDESTSGGMWSGFGAVALRGDMLLVGAPGTSEDSFLDGVAYLYQYVDGYWYTQLRLTHAEDGGFGDFFGSSVAIQGDTLLIAAPSEYGQTTYVFEIGER
jgi:hypothetical protein